MTELLPACFPVSDMQTALSSYIKTCHLEEKKQNYTKRFRLDWPPTPPFSQIHAPVFVADKHPQTFLSHQDLGFFFFCRFHQLHTEILIVCSLVAKFM